MLAAFNFGDTELKDYELTLPAQGQADPAAEQRLAMLWRQDREAEAAGGKACDGKLKLTLAPFSGRLYKLV